MIPVERDEISVLGERGGERGAVLPVPGVVLLFLEPLELREVVPAARRRLRDLVGERDATQPEATGADHGGGDPHAFHLRFLSFGVNEMNRRKEMGSESSPESCDPRSTLGVAQPTRRAYPIIRWSPTRGRSGRSCPSAIQPCRA